MEKNGGVFKAGNHVLTMNRTYIMGILNVTPDSFSDGGSYSGAKEAVAKAKQMIEEGADIIDVGGQSTRPNFKAISAGEEWDRIEPVLKGLLEETSAIISADTFYPEVAEKALEMGVHIINDVTGFDAKMQSVVAKSCCGCIVMHPCEMTEDKDVCNEAKGFFEKRFLQMQNSGIEAERICLDPGIGFGKSYEQNLELIVNVEMYRISDRPVLMAASRKRVIGTAMKKDVEASERDAGTIAAHTVSQVFGANILRVHDVKTACEAARVCDEVLRMRKP